MKRNPLLVTSDLTLGASSRESVATLAREMAAKNPSAVVVAGNLGETLEELRTALTLLKTPLECPLAFVPGNQDLFFQENCSSHDLWTHVLRREVEALGVTYLQGTTLDLGGISVTGSIGWYDYSTALPELNRTQEYWIQSKFDHNVADALRIDWEWSDPEFATLVGRSLVATLDSLEKDPLVKKVAVVTHFPVFDWQLPTLTTGFEGEAFQKILRAYQGSLPLGQEILKRNKVAFVASGHVGIAGSKSIQRPGTHAVQGFLTGSTPEKPGFVEINLD